jgi:hypothetical protein
LASEFSGGQVQDDKVVPHVGLGIAPNPGRQALQAEVNAELYPLVSAPRRTECDVRFHVGRDVAATRAGQIATLALVNLVSRAHRRLVAEIPSAPLRARSLVPADDFQTAAIRTARAINPVIDLTASISTPIRIGLGQNVPGGLDLYLGWLGGRGTVSTTSLTTSDSDPESVFGAATAAVLGAAAVFRLAHDQPARTARFNPIELGADHAAGLRDHRTPVDAGDVLAVGAGAVTAALVYWLRELGIAGGTWDFLDGDEVKLHNTNRCMTITAAAAGWPNGQPTMAPGNKAAAVAWVINGRPHPIWYDQWQLDRHGRHDLVLPLANERGVRRLIAYRGEPLLMHATTSPNWTAELHRHLPDRDDCIDCRLPDTTAPRMQCSTGPTDVTDSTSPDAALPFLSAGAGLMLAAALATLPDGPAMTGRFNHWQFDLTLAIPLVRPHQHQLRQACREQPSAALRSLISESEPRRWDYLDHGDD